MMPTRAASTWQRQRSRLPCTDPALTDPATIDPLGPTAATSGPARAEDLPLGDREVNEGLVSMELSRLAIVGPRGLDLGAGQAMEGDGRWYKVMEGGGR